MGNLQLLHDPFTRAHVFCCFCVAKVIVSKQERLLRATKAVKIVEQKDDTKPNGSSRSGRHCARQRASSSQFLLSRQIPSTCALSKSAIVLPNSHSKNPRSTSQARSTRPLDAVSSFHHVHFKVFVANQEMCFGCSNTPHTLSMAKGDGPSASCCQPFPQRGRD